MPKNAVVVAHFDPNNRLEENFRLVLRCFEKVFDVVVLVTTCDLPEAETEQFKKVVTIRRPNIGYDFYSYRVGLSYLDEKNQEYNILIANSSFVIIKTETFMQLLTEMLDRIETHDVIGITESQQFHWHIQSYLLMLGNKVLRNRWLKEFFNNIQPLNTKFEVILSYEIGLSRALVANNAMICVLFKPSLKQRVSGYYRWMRIVAKTDGMMTGKPLRYWRDVNWTHFGAKQIAAQFGFVKTEILRTNPNDISTGYITGLADPEALASIETLLDNTQNQYQLGGDGLTVLASSSQCLPTSRIVRYGNAGIRGVRVAVVIHLFYIELLNEICGSLRNIMEPYDLYVTTPFEGDIHRIINRSSYMAQSVTIILTENRGRDIGPFVLLYRTGLLDSYMAVLKLHTKRSRYSHKGEYWRHEIYRGVMGGSELISGITALFERSDIGMVGIGRYYLSNHEYWGADKESVKRLLLEVDEIKTGDEPELGFFAGSMFWFRPQAFISLKLLPDDNLLFESENGAQDGTLAHAIERIFCLIARGQGFIVTSPELAGVDINSTRTVDNRIPVL